MMTTANQKVFVVFNPKAGKEDQAAEVRAALTQHFTPPQAILGLIWGGLGVLVAPYL